MNNFWFAVFLCASFFVMGFLASEEGWAERAEKGYPVVVKGKVYKVEEQSQ